MPCCGGLTKGFVDLPLGMLWGIDAVREGRRNQEKGWTLGEFNSNHPKQAGLFRMVTHQKNQLVPAH